ncbi:unnamed protein product [Ixodes pacificus]
MCILATELIFTNEQVSQWLSCACHLHVLTQSVYKCVTALPRSNSVELDCPIKLHTQCCQKVKHSAIWNKQKNSSYETFHALSHYGSSSDAINPSYKDQPCFQFIYEHYRNSRIVTDRMRT